MKAATKGWGRGSGRRTDAEDTDSATTALSGHVPVPQRFASEKVQTISALVVAAGVSNFAQTPLGPCAYNLFEFSQTGGTPNDNQLGSHKTLSVDRSGRRRRRYVPALVRFGFMSRNAAEKLASMSSERAVVAVLAPVCADKFAALPDVAARTATLVADKDNSYKMRDAFPEAMITLPGKSYPDSDLTAACAGLILAPPKTADLKQ
jgi:hypothetical protein